MALFTSGTTQTGTPGAPNYFFGITDGPDHDQNGDSPREIFFGDYGDIYTDADYGVNDTIGSAFNLSADPSYWYTADVPTIDTSGIPHTTLYLLGADEASYFRVTTTGANQTINVDVDFASFDSVVQIVDGSGNELAWSDDDVEPIGELSGLASNVTYTAAIAGTYFIRIGQFQGANATEDNSTNVQSGDIVAGNQAIVHVSVSNHAATGDNADFTGSDDVISGGGFDDQLFGLGGDDTLEGGAGDDVLDGGDGTDTVSYASDTTGVTVDLGAMTASGGAAAGDTLFNFENATGGSGADTLTGNGDDNVLRGGSGTDTLVGGGGVDELYGEAGDDILFVDTALYSAGNIFDGGDDTDTLQIVSDGNVASVNFTNSTLESLELLILDNGPAPTDLTLRFTGEQFAGFTDIAANSHTGFTNRLRIDLSALSDFDVSDVVFTGFDEPGDGLAIYGDTDSETIIGSALDDIIRGRDGNDTIEGGAGADDLNGGTGDGDTLSYAGSGAGVTVTLSGASSGGDAEGDVNFGFERLTGSGFDDVLTGNGAANRIEGGEGADTIIGGAGEDTMFGGAGDDTFRFETAGVYNDNRVDGDSGTDTILIAGDGIFDFSDRGMELSELEAITFSRISMAAATLILSDDEINTSIELSPSAAITGHVGGADTIQVDTTSVDVETLNLSGWVFTDWEAGDSIIINGETSGGQTDVRDQTITGTVQSDTINGGRGDDVLNGGDGDDILNGDDGNDTLNGGAGNDTLNGGLGDDRFIFINGEVTGNIDGGDGIDTVDASNGGSITLDLSANFLHNGVVNTITNVENVRGSAFIDSITGNDDDNVIEGGAGGDTLNGGLGTDTLSYAGSAGFVTVTLDGASSDNDAAGDTNSGFENLIGSGFDDVLTGNADDNVITGGSGADTIDGDGGVNTADYSGSADGVTVDLAAGTGTDGDAQGDSLSNIQSLIGSSGDDTLLGSATQVQISGGDDNDIILTGSNATSGAFFGEAGDDTLGYSFDGLNRTLNLGGVLIFDGGDGTDTFSFDNFGENYSVDLATGVYTRLLNGLQYAALSDIENIIAGRGNDTLIGNDEINNLSGGSGNDIISGGLGADILSGGDGIDTLDYSAETGNLTVFLSGNQSVIGAGSDGDTISGFENVNFGSGNDIGVTSAAVNVMNMGAGDDSLQLNQNLIAAHTLNGGLGNDSIQLFFQNVDADIDFRTTTISEFENIVFSGNYGAENSISINASQLTDINFVSVTARDDTLTDLAVNVFTGIGETVDLSVINFQGFTSTDDVVNFTGAAADEIITGSSINDAFTGAAGNDTLNGEAGNDTAIYSGNINDYAITLNMDGTTTVTDNNTADGDDGTDTLRNIENIQFADATQTDDFSNFIGGAQTVATDASVTDGTIETLGDNDIFAVNLVAGQFYQFELESNTSDYTLFDSVLRLLDPAGTEIDNNDDGGLSFGSRIIFEADQTDTYYLDVIGFDNSYTGTYGFSARDASIIGTNAAETLDGTALFDVIDGLDGNDVLNGLDGNDVLQGGAGADTLNGGLGIDTASYADSGASVRVNLTTGTALDADAEGDSFTDIENVLGSAFNDNLTGNADENMLSGGDGIDRLFGEGGNDTLNGDAGNDRLFGGDGEDRLAGGADDDFLQGGAGDDAIEGGDGVDDINGQAGNDEMSGGAGDDMIFGSFGEDELYGQAGDDSLNGGADSDYIEGGSGEDFIFGGSAVDTIFGGDDNDEVLGGSGSDMLFGGDGNDVMLGGFGSDTIYGDAGDDELSGFQGLDVLYGGAGNDDIRGGDNGDTLYGGADDDTLRGNDANDFLYGEDGDDTLNGGSGNDLLDGGLDDGDFMTGAAGNDTFVYGTGYGADFINDFDDAGNDVIDLTAFGFTDYAAQVATLMTQVGVHVQLDFGMDNILQLRNTDIADMDAGDFLL